MYIYIHIYYPLRRTLNSRIQRFCEGLWNLGFLEGLSSAGPYVKDSFKDSLVKAPHVKDSIKDSLVKGL